MNFDAQSDFGKIFVTKNYSIGPFLSEVCFSLDKNLRMKSQKKCDRRRHPLTGKLLSSSEA